MSAVAPPVWRTRYATNAAYMCNTATGIDSAEYVKSRVVLCTSYAAVI